MCNSRERQLPTEADRQKLHELYLKHHREVYGICLRMTQDVSESEDLTQEVFLHLFRTIGSLRGESALQHLAASLNGQYRADALPKTQEEVRAND